MLRNTCTTSTSECVKLSISRQVERGWCAGRICPAKGVLTPCKSSEADWGLLYGRSRESTCRTHGLERAARTLHVQSTRRCRHSDTYRFSGESSASVPSPPAWRSSSRISCTAEILLSITCAVANCARDASSTARTRSLSGGKLRSRLRLASYNSVSRATSCSRSLALSASDRLSVSSSASYLRRNASSRDSSASFCARTYESRQREGDGAGVGAFSRVHGDFSTSRSGGSGCWWLW
jgi:hypothetical protein